MYHSAAFIQPKKVNLMLDLFLKFLQKINLDYFFFFNDTATTEIYTLSLHDALPICSRSPPVRRRGRKAAPLLCWGSRSEEHTPELQSQSNLVCRLLLEKKTPGNNAHYYQHNGWYSTHTILYLDKLHTQKTTTPTPPN